ncbi:MAG: glycoside hydrolase family 9 protein [Flavitalea sp.]
MTKAQWLFVSMLLNVLIGYGQQKDTMSWIRVNQLGYVPAASKVAVWCSKSEKEPESFTIIDVLSGKMVLKSGIIRQYGGYGPFKKTARLNFSSLKQPGRYVIVAGGVSSPEFTIAGEVYKGAADFCLRYMRQQRSGFNPYLKDSCHTYDGYTLYGPMPDSTRIDAVGGWHDASDYLQYVPTTANATWHLLAAYRDFPAVFGDHYASNGLAGANGNADVIDEAKWGLDWLVKMNPDKNIFFNQLGDDRDHRGIRLPKLDSFYGRGYERPVYFLSGKPQQQGKKGMNHTTGAASTAGKFSSTFSLGSDLMLRLDSAFAGMLREKSVNAYQYGKDRPGFAQTASVLSPYVYAEENWTDDMELAASELYRKTKNPKFLTEAIMYSREEKLTPWLGKDTAAHYQWYPFINVGHYELAKLQSGKQRKETIAFYKRGIEVVLSKAKQNAFYRGIPFIWCSNNLTTSFAIQCYWYRELSGDNSFVELEQACFDWLFGCNPWGTSMVYGLPRMGDTPMDPHSAFTHLGNFPIDGGLVDGPVYGSIYNNLIGIKLYSPDEYAAFQSDLVVYHDDYGDYSTNEPTMDGTASLIYLLAQKESEGVRKPKAITRGDTTQKKIALVFTGHEFADGGEQIAKTLTATNTKASFFFTGDFYSKYKPLVKRLIKDGHYLGAHSDKHLLYCDWTKRDSLLVTRAQFMKDLDENYAKMRKAGIEVNDAGYFLPPYEWYNDSIVEWTSERGLQLVNYSPGTRSNADYTTPSMKNYVGSSEIFSGIENFEANTNSGLNGFLLLLHIGTEKERTDKFYNKLDALISLLRSRQYEFVRVDELPGINHRSQSF